MVRGKVELKRIENKANRRVSFTKRWIGLVKKARELSILCDVDIVLFVNSSTNRLYKFSTANSMTEILDDTNDKSMGKKQSVERHLNEQKILHSDVTELYRLEKETMAILQKVRTKKTELMLGVDEKLARDGIHACSPSKVTETREAVDGRRGNKRVAD